MPESPPSKLVILSLLMFSYIAPIHHYIFKPSSNFIFKVKSSPYNAILVNK